MPQPPLPVIVRIVESPTPETTVADVLIGAIGLTGVLIVGAILLGVLAGCVLVGAKWLRASRAEPDGPISLGLGGPPAQPVPARHPTGGP